MLSFYGKSVAATWIRDILRRSAAMASKNLLQYALQSANAHCLPAKTRTGLWTFMVGLAISEKCLGAKKKTLLYCGFVVEKMAN